jgi:four helix bundle protein
MFNFGKLEVWKKTISFVDKIYNATRTFPQEEVFVVTSQLRRAAISISLNIAEGAGRKSKKEFKHFITIAYGSLCEIITLLEISFKRRYLNKDSYNKLYKDCEEIAKMLSGLSKL